jgi:hypothetical protein
MNTAPSNLEDEGTKFLRNTNVPSQKSVTLDSIALETSSLPEFPFLEGGELIVLLRDYWLVRGRSVKLAVQRR